MRLLVSFAALFLAVAFVQLGSGVLGPLDALSGSKLGFTSTQIGLLGSAHFVGFFGGCLLVPRLMGGIGHSRAFAAMAAIGVIGALAHPMLEHPVAWAGLRVLGGASVAGCYTVAESWLQAKAENADRGRVSGTYRTVDMSASVVGQLLIGVLPPATYVAYNTVAIFLCLCLLPLVLTRATAPPLPRTPKVALGRTLRMSPLGAAGVVTVGLTNSSFRMVGPVFGERSGLTPWEIGLFLAAALGAGALVQPVIGALADRFDRRRMLIAQSLLALGACAALTLGPETRSFAGLMAASALFGATAFPLYSLSAAHANDRCPPDQVVELAASLMILYGIGAIVSPLLASEVIEAFGPNAMFAYIGAAHGLLIAFGLWRLASAPSATKRTPYRWRTRTALTLERLLKRRR